MEKLIDPAFAQALKEGRDRFNTKYALARRTYTALNAELFMEHLRSAVAPAVSAVNGFAPEKVFEVVEALYHLSLELVGKAIIGEETKHAALTAAWKKLMPALPHLLAGEPGRFPTSVVNAVYNLSATGGARAAYWVDAMTEIGGSCEDVTSFLEAGKVLAWRSGMAHYRQGALEACLRLDPEIARAALALNDYPVAPIDHIVERLSRDPWLAPADTVSAARYPKRLRIVTAVGAFRGFGGAFITPPRVARADGEFMVYDDENCWAMTADLFGATLHRAGKSRPKTETDQGEFKIDPHGRVSRGGLTGQFPELSNATSFASDETTLAVTIPVSHSVYLVAHA